MSQPAIFLSHGSPMTALQSAHPATKYFKKMISTLPRVPSAIVIVSGHFLGRSYKVSTSDAPSTIYDFGGFPSELYQMQFTSPGNPSLGHDIISLLKTNGLNADSYDGGRDHGIWMPLKVANPSMDIPVVSVSMLRSGGVDEAWELGSALRCLREQNILIIGSGMATHNLSDIFSERDVPYMAPFEKAFDSAVALSGSDRKKALQDLIVSPHGRAAHPQDDHFLPVAVVAATGGTVTKVVQYRVGR